ncbi:MAG: DUF937 domain-containing protein [Cyclobacteriaceae bacterium]|nr:DUF937 domain-containing protein [Cyclobacteriaceae bacterium]
MLDQLINLVQEHAGESIVNNPAIDNRHNQAAITEVAQQIFSGLQQHASAGNLQQISSLFQGGSQVAGHPIVSGLIRQVAGVVASKFGVSPTAAQQMASGLLPTVMSQLVSKTNDVNDNSFDMSSMMQSITGNSGFDISTMLGGLGGNGSGNGLGGALGKLFGN